MSGKNRTPRARLVARTIRAALVAVVVFATGGASAAAYEGGHPFLSALLILLALGYGGRALEGMTRPS